eukprot:scaffold7373_cov232-Pinguiococcus_pyrenoidosus.AAC.1
MMRTVVSKPSEEARRGWAPRHGSAPNRMCVYIMKPKAATAVAPIAAAFGIAWRGGATRREGSSAPVAVPLKLWRVIRGDAELEGAHPEHGPSREAQSHGQEADELVHKQIGRDGHDGLRRAGDERPERGLEDGNAARHHGERHGEALGDVVDREGHADEDSKASLRVPFPRLVAAEGHPDADPLGEGVQGHDDDDEDHSLGVDAVRAREL